LAVILASASYMADVAKDAQNHELAECAQDTLLAAERIGSFVQHVCGFARRERPELSDRPLGPTVEMALRMVRPRARDRKVEVVFQAGAGPRVPHDPPRLAQAVLNLLSNAIDAAADGGRHVSVEVVSRNGDEVAIIVDDDGPGIAAQIIDKVFEPFATTKPVGQGTGLGLAISGQIVSDHGGRISLARLDHGGTRAEIALRPLEPSRYSVLVLDEHPALTRSLGAVLRRDGFEVESAGTLAGALQILSAKRPAVIVTDLCLPDAVGSELLWMLREASAGARLLVVTSAVRRVPGADRILEKPCDREELIAAVRQLCVQFEAARVC
jgi:CheY-like chemotaxis protein